MKYIQESAANSYVQIIDSAQVSLSKETPLTMKQLGIELAEETTLFTKKDFEDALKKVCRKIKK